MQYGEKMKHLPYFIVSEQIKRNACAAIMALDIDQNKPFVVQIKAKTRSLEQSAKMWAMLAEVSAQVVWHSRKLTAEEWKWVFSASLKKQEAVPGLDGGFVILGQSTSDMTISKMKDMIELIHAFGAENSVVFRE